MSIAQLQIRIVFFIFFNLSSASFYHALFLFGILDVSYQKYHFYQRSCKHASVTPGGQNLWFKASIETSHSCGVQIAAANTQLIKNNWTATDQ